MSKLSREKCVYVLIGFGRIHRSHSKFGISRPLSCYLKKDYEDYVRISPVLLPSKGLLVNKIRYRTTFAMTTSSSQALLTSAFGPDNVKVLPMACVPTKHTLRYLETKKLKTFHSTIMRDFTLPVPKEADGMRIAIISTAWNEEFVEPIREECEKALRSGGVKKVGSL